MLGFERIVTDISKRCYADVANRHPALELVMAGAMEQVRDADGSHGCGRLQARASCRDFDHIVGEEHLLSATGLEVASGGIVHTPGHGNSGKECQICTIPEGVWRRRSGRGWRIRRRGRER